MNVIHKFSKDEQKKFLRIYLKDEFKLIDYLTDKYAWFKEMNQEAIGLENLDMIFDLSPQEVEECVEQNIEIVFKYRHMEGVAEWSRTTKGFKYTGFERGVPGESLCFKDIEEFAQFVCLSWVAYIPRYSKVWHYNPRRCTEED